MSALQARRGPFWPENRSDLYKRMFAALKEERRRLANPDNARCPHSDLIVDACRDIIDEARAWEMLGGADGPLLSDRLLRAVAPLLGVEP